MKGLEGLAPYPRRAAFLLFAVAAGTGLAFSATTPGLAPAAAFGPAGIPGGASGWAGIDRGAAAAGAYVLSPRDADLYRNVFRLQAKGDIAGADRMIERLADRSLLGHVLAHRHLEVAGYRSSERELYDWLTAFADHPDSGRIYRLALARKGSGAGGPPRPQAADLGPFRATPDERAAMTRAPAPDEASPAQRLSVPRSEPRADDAAQLLFGGNAKKAYALASAKAGATSGGDPGAHWTAGLAAWALGKYAEAGGHFEAVAAAPKAGDWTRSAGAYWAARAHLAARHPEQVNRFLTMAAAYPRTFYGLLAATALGLKPDFNWEVPALDNETLTPLLSLPAGRRALALIQIGETQRAEAELRAVAPGANQALAHAIFAVANRASMPQLLYQMGSRLRDRDGRPFDSALYPLPDWQPAEGYVIDRALIFAIVRQESEFRPDAESPAGAQGLMQIMPPTATFIAGKGNLGKEAAAHLLDPYVNLSLGQAYIRRLLEHGEIGGDLFRLAAAYNGGIGNVLRWRERLTDDPLLFIESIPFRETRAYVERVLTNFWMYRLRLGQPSPSLEALAAGEWPVYQPVETDFGTVIAELKD